jgi:putative copper export protein
MQEILLGLNIWLVIATIFKAITYGATFTASGGVIFCDLFRNQLSKSEAKTIKRFIIIVTWIAILTSFLRILVTNIILSGEFSAVYDLALARMVLESNEGVATGLRLVSLIAILSLSSNKFYDQFESVLLFAAILAATSFSLVGHAGEVSMKYGLGLIPQGLLLLHLIAVAFWVGALWPLRMLTMSNDRFRVAKIMHDFGSIAVIFVSVLIVAGVFLIWLLLGKLDLLWTTEYGQLMLTKLATVSLLLAMAAINKLLITPKLLSQNNKSEMGILRKSINLEIALVGLILFVTASFTTLVGPS